MHVVTIFTDGSCLGNPGRGGWAAILRCNGRERLISGGFRETTAHRMEMMAVVCALETLTKPAHVTIHTDSRNVESFILAGGIKRRAKEPKHSDLRQRVFAAMAIHKVTAVWLKGHAGHVENELCDDAAGRAARQPNLPDDPGYGATAIEGSLFAEFAA